MRNYCPIGHVIISFTCPMAQFIVAQVFAQAGLQGCGDFQPALMEKKICVSARSADKTTQLFMHGTKKDASTLQGKLRSQILDI